MSILMKRKEILYPTDDLYFDDGEYPALEFYGLLPPEDEANYEVNFPDYSLRMWKEKDVLMGYAYDIDEETPVLFRLGTEEFLEKVYL